MRSITESPRPIDEGITFKAKPDIKDLLMDLREADLRFHRAVSTGTRGSTQEQWASKEDLDAYLFDALKFRMDHPFAGINVWMEGVEGEEIHPFSDNRVYTDFSQVRGIEGGITLFRGSLRDIAKHANQPKMDSQRFSDVFLRGSLPLRREDPSRSIMRTHNEIRSTEKHYSSNNPEERNEFLSNLRDKLVQRAMILKSQGAWLLIHKGDSTHRNGKRIILKFGDDEKTVLPYSDKYLQMMAQAGVGFDIKFATDPTPEMQQPVTGTA